MPPAARPCETCALFPSTLARPLCPIGNQKPVWLITGCSTGFGRELSEILISRNYRVVVTARDPAKIADIVEGHAETAVALKLDVDMQREIEAAVEAVRRAVRTNRRSRQQRRLWLPRGDRGRRGRRYSRDVRDQRVRPRGDDPRGVAAHAGAKVGRDRQHFIDGRFHRLSGLGLLRGDEIRRRRPFQSLSKEVAPLGIKVVIVEPGPFRTDWAGRSLKTAKRPIEAYADTAVSAPAPDTEHQRLATGRSRARGRGDHRTVESQYPPLRLPLGSFAYDAMGAELEALRKEHGAVESVARGADYRRKE